MSVTITGDTYTPTKKVIFTWTSDGDGDATGTTTYTHSGKLICLTTIPSGVAAPTADYDIVVNDDDGHDVLLGQGADRHTSNTEYVAEASLGAVANSQLTIVVSNAGDTKSGTCILYIR